METNTWWATLSAQPFPYLHELTPMERDRFVLLDAYLRDCIEEWFTTGFRLSARSVVLLDDCVRTITKRFTLLDGEGQFYFGQYRSLARRILHGLDVDQAHRQAEQEMAADPDLVDLLGEPLTDLVVFVEPP